MRHPDGAHTHGSGGPGGLVLVILGAAVVAAIAGPAVAAVAELLRLVLIAAAVMVGVAGLGLVALVAYRLRRSRTGSAPAGSLPAPTLPARSQALSAPRPRAIERAAGLHLHFHGLTAEEAAAIVRQARPVYGTGNEHPAIEED